MPGKQLTIAGIVLLCAVIVASVLYLHKNQQLENTAPILAVPQGTAIMVKVNKPEELKKALATETEFKTELNRFETFKSLTTLISDLDSSTFFSTSPVSDILKRPFIISFYTDSTITREWLFSSALKSRSEITELKRAFEHLGKSAIIKAASGLTVQVSKDGGWPLDARMALYNGYVLVSPSAELIEQAISAINKKQSLAHLPDFSRLLIEKPSGSMATVVVNYSRLDDYVKDLFKTPLLSRFANSSELDLDVRKDAIYLNGFTYDKSGSFASIFKGIEAQKPELINILPSETRFMAGYSMVANSHFRDNLNTFIAETERHAKIKELNEKFTARHKSPFDEMFFSVVDGEGAFAYLSGSSANSYLPVLVFKTTGEARTLEMMEELMRNNGQSTEPVEWIRLDDDTRFPLYNTPETAIFKAYWSTLFPEVPARYFAFYRNYIIFGDQQEAISQVLYSNILNKTLSTHPYYSTFAENFSYRENFFIFCEIAHILNLSGDNINRKQLNPTNEQRNALNNFYAVGLQFSSASNLVYTSVYANYTPHRDKEPRTIWQSRLDSTIVSKPALVDNHNTGEKEILVQDKKNNLYLINSMGRILWKRTLDGPVLSDFYQIDYYKNNKIQYLFNTADKIYILDRNGNHVARFPVSLPAKATNGLNVFDYDNDKEYRIFIALEDKRVYLYDKTGNINPGWSQPRYEGTVTQTLQHFSAQGKDYIVFSDEYRNYILDRRGDERTRPSQNFTRNGNSPFFMRGRTGDKPSLVTTTQGGELAVIELPSGNTSLKPLLSATTPHHFVLINENSPSPEYIITTEKSLILYDKNLKEAMRVDFENEIFPMADIYRFSNTDVKFGVVEKTGGRIHLINRDGSHYRGFPLKAVSRFSIGFLKSSAYRFNLITGGDFNYLYNYRVE